jgi:hypothetical protein
MELTLQCVEPIHSRCVQLLRAGNTLQGHPKALAHFRRWKTVQERRSRLLDRIAACAAAAPTVGYLHLREQPATHPLVDLALRLLSTRQTNATSCTAREHMPEAEQKATVKHFEAVFKVGIENAWVLPLLDEIERAAHERQSAEARRLNLQIDELSAYSKADPPSSENEHAQRILIDARKVMQAWPVQFDFPTWLDAPIVAFVLTHFGFARGGGGGKTSRATFQTLLTQPARLAAKIEATPSFSRRLKRQLSAMRRPQVYWASEVPLSRAPLTD